MSGEWRNPADPSVSPYAHVNKSRAGSKGRFAAELKRLSPPMTRAETERLVNGLTDTDSATNPIVQRWRKRK